MLQLTIDGQRVNLDPDISLEIVKCNPFLTKIGEYTYDIDVDLRDPQNAKVYSHINRLHAFSYPRGRTATLMDGARVICRGLEVLLGVEDSIVKIQILAGNSELNYLVGSEVDKIREMDFGSMPIATVTDAIEISKKLYPEVNYTFPTLKFVGDDGEIKYANDGLHLLGVTPGSYSPPLKGQPFLLYYIERLVSLLGYTLEYNCLANDARWKRLIIVDSDFSLEYAKHLPDWTVSEFIDEVEKFFNCIFLLDTLHGSVSIVQAKDFYQDESHVEIISREDLIDRYSRTFETEGLDAVDADNVAYNFPDREYYKYANLNDELEGLCSVVPVNIEDINTIGGKDSDFTIYESTDGSMHFVFDKDGKMQNGDAVKLYKQVNQFKSVAKDERQSTLSLNIVPAEIEMAYDISPVPPYEEYGYTRCVSRNVYEEVPVQTLKDMISSGIHAESVGKTMEVCFCLGLTLGRKLNGVDSSGYQKYNIYCGEGVEDCPTVPVITVHEHLGQPIMGVNQVFSYTIAECGGIDPLTLSLDGVNGRVLTDFSSLSFDASEEQTMRFRTNKILSPMSLYIVDNRLFYCKELRSFIENGKLGTVVEAKLFPAV